MSLHVSGRGGGGYANAKTLAALTMPLLLQMIAMFGGSHALMLPAWVQWALATPQQFWVGRSFYQSAWNVPRGGTAKMFLIESRLA